MTETPAAHPYSEVRVLDADRAHVSGVLPYAPDGTLVTGDTADVVHACLATLEGRLRAAGFELADVVAATVYTTDLTTLATINEIWAATFPEPRPARAAVEVSRLPRGATLEVQATVERAPRAS